MRPERSVGAEHHDLAYLFSTFPSFTKTFCVREVEGLRAQGRAPLVFSMRDAGLEKHRPFPASLYENVITLPDRKEVKERLGDWLVGKDLQRSFRSALPRWRKKADSQRLYEAAFVGAAMKQHGLTHVHAHFAGMAARTSYWIKKIFGFTYSFTAHANDIFCPNEFEVSRQRLVEGASAVIVESRYASDWLEQKFPAARGKTFVVHNGLDVDRIGSSPLERAQTADPPLIVSVGRFVEKKGFPVLVEACSILRDLGVAFRCSIVGLGPLEEDLRSRIAGCGLQDLMELPGPLTQREIFDLFRRARLFVLPCVQERGGGSDNLPTAIMEAMAAGLPCVSTRLAGIPEMIDHGETGLLLEPGDAPGLAEAMRRLLEEPETAGAMGRAGQRRAKERFGQSRTTAELWKVLQPLCSATGR